MKKEQCVTVVLITEETPMHAYEESMEVFTAKTHSDLISSVLQFSALFTNF